MNKYGAIWRELGVEVMAETTYAAQGLALPLLQDMAGRRKVKRYEITVMLMELNGVEYIHVAS
jgi:ribosomal protein L20A (L18A)